MKVYTDINHLGEFKNAVVTIGTFDGVHLGHQKIIDQLKSEARRVSGETVIITFHPHPRKIVSAGEGELKLITTVEERIELLEEKGVDHLVIVPFTKMFSELEPEQYVEDFLYAKFHPAVVIIGYDHKFGKERKGDYKLLEEYSSRLMFELREIPQHLINHNTVSSTQIRNSLLNGDINQARSLLGYDFFFEGVVVKGDQLGRKLGFPTANLEIKNEDKLVPYDGVYVVEVLRMNTSNLEWTMVDENTREVEETANEKRTSNKLRGMMSIGFRPTVEGTTKRIEVNIFDFDEDIYGETLRVYVKKYLRPEYKLNSLEELKAIIAQDREDSLKYFEK